MIVVILLQRSEGGGLGMGRTDALFSVRGQANVLSRATAIFAGLFFFLSLLMAWSVGEPGQRASRSIMDNVHNAPAPTASRRRAAALPRRVQRAAGSDDPVGALSPDPLGTTTDDRPFPPPKLLRREDIPMAASNQI